MSKPEKPTPKPMTDEEFEELRGSFEKGMWSESGYHGRVISELIATIDEERNKNRALRNVAKGHLAAAGILSEALLRVEEVADRLDRRLNTIRNTPGRAETAGTRGHWEDRGRIKGYSVASNMIRRAIADELTDED